MFLETFFPQVFSLDFGSGPEGKEEFIAFVQRLMEHYTIYRFIGSGEAADHTHNQWANNRSKFMEPDKARKGKQPVTNTGSGTGTGVDKTGSKTIGGGATGKSTLTSAGNTAGATSVALAPPVIAYQYKVGDRVRVRYHLYFDVVGRVVDNLYDGAKNTKVLIEHCFKPSTSTDIEGVSPLNGKEIMWLERDVEPDTGK